MPIKIPPRNTFNLSFFSIVKLIDFHFRKSNRKTTAKSARQPIVTTGGKVTALPRTPLVLTKSIARLSCKIFLK